MARKPKNPINDIVDTVGGWLGGRGPGTNPQVQAAMDATRAVGKVVDTATGGFGQALISDAQRMAQSGSSTPSALYKTAAVNLGAAAAGVGAAKVVGKVAQSGRVANPVAAALNAIKGERVVVSGTPNKIKGSLLNPKISDDVPDTPVVYSWNPRGPYAQTVLPNKAASFSRGAGQGFSNPHNAQRNVVVGTVKKSSTTPHFGGMESEALISTTPIKIKKIIKAPVSNMSDAAQRKYVDELRKAVAKSGSSLRGQPLADRLDTPRINQLRLAASRQKLKIDKRLNKR